ncbi:hypothetical protein BATDEDRAFT_86473 [Batrachochytrium dendrobatidis JAM81]|uniref:Single-strand binding protein n=2 Tax=Batrachochytrium dendrobatidis TaxID=109871 RepID=F4NVX4_BATDJ|nr:uncharacterized protein BATDEDRAFT_86473 [Batrachochytrium dendrobatidis JAM81]EGF82730.1 hypothetical protein BATDEDRAFT_86473 [Batrachochytrium dendrobatidis JAM81]KAK5673332.1 hypothetical protein QVD99_000782 [Batrachochytrium dendrobatidis]OAJ39777.1 single-strand binding protein family [Batrachochytrium dendrobatidis JEL423]|eukprot:XP_006677032.1 hypothetical protein BATDEDRAFT_86473 [Batrachochytrium dendrobatidis JAM81]
MNHLTAQFIRKSAAQAPLCRRFSVTTASSMYNRVTLVGNVGQLPTFHEFPARSQEDGGAVSETSSASTATGVWTFSVATNRSKKSFTGEWVRETDWHRIKSYRDMSNLTPGQKVLVEGEIRYWRSGEKSGTEIHANKVVAFNHPATHQLGDEVPMPEN